MQWFIFMLAITGCYCHTLPHDALDAKSAEYHKAPMKVAWLIDAPKVIEVVPLTEVSKLIWIMPLIQAGSNKFSLVPDRKGAFTDWLTGMMGLKPAKPEPKPEECTPCQCGKARTRKRIIGGQETGELQFPWMAALTFDNQFFCGSALISSNYVLTAAHCTFMDKRNLNVRFLDHDMSNPSETMSFDRKVAAIIRHPKYNPSTFDNDIALLKLDQRVDFSQTRYVINTSGKREKVDVGARPVCLASPGNSYEDFEGIVTGWGTTVEGHPSTISDLLLKANVPIISNTDCKNMAYRNTLTENMMCAGVPQGGVDACQGDSGGPLHILNATSGQYQEVGIVSWGDGCGRPQTPGVYTRVSRYLDWIKKNTKGECFCS